MAMFSVFLRLPVRKTPLLAFCLRIIIIPLHSSGADMPVTLNGLSGALFYTDSIQKNNRI